MDVRKRKSLKKYSSMTNAIKVFYQIYLTRKKSHKNGKSGKKDKMNIYDVKFFER